MRNIWKGAITFGPVSVPVKLYPVVSEHKLALNQVHTADGGRIRHRYVCEVCGKEVAYRDISKAYTDQAGRQAVLSDSDFADLPVPSKKVIDVLAFVPAEDIDPLMLSTPYYIGADEVGSAKPYALLRDELKQSGKVAVTKITLRTRESLALLRVHDDTLVLHTMRYPDEIQSAAGLAPSAKAEFRPQELKMVETMMDIQSEGFELENVRDDYHEAFEKLVAAKLEGKPAPTGEEAVTAAPDNVVDMMAAIQARIDEHNARAKESPKAAAQSGPAAKKATRGKAAAKKTGTAKKTTAKKSAKKTASKTAAKKSASRAS